MRITLENVKPLSPGIWSSRLPPSDVRRIGDGRRNFGERSLIALIGPTFTADAAQISFDPAQASVLNVGSALETILVDLASTGSTETSNAPEVVKAGGDAAFLIDCHRLLPEKVAALAERLLTEIRGKYPGELREGGGRRWTSYPRNFVSFVIQNRLGCLEVSVKLLDGHEYGKSISVLPSARTPYGSFKLTNEAQLKDTVDAVAASYRRG